MLDQQMIDDLRAEHAELVQRDSTLGDRMRGLRAQADELQEKCKVMYNLRNSIRILLENAGVSLETDNAKTD